MKINSPLQAYEHLPKTNCGDCGEPTCMAFASHMLDRSKKVEECPHLLDEKYDDNYKILTDLLAPEIREVVIGTGDHAITIGGDDVLYRHKLTFFNKTAFAYDVWDTMGENELVSRVNKIQNFTKFYIGDFLTLDAIAIRCVSGDADQFARTVSTVIATTELPLVLCSLDAGVLSAALEIASDRKPLIYAATTENWRDIAELVLKYDVPVVLSKPGDPDALKSLALTFESMGINDLVLDPGTSPTDGLRDSFENFLKLRRAGIDGQTDIAYPLMAVPMTAWAELDGVSAAYWESVLASVFTVRYGDIAIMHGIEPYALLPELHIRDTVYTDPRKPVMVDSGVFEIGSPDQQSPVIITTNFALTYYTVESDLASNDIGCYLCVVDTDGIGVEAAVAGGQLTAAKIKDAFASAGFDVQKKTDHGTIILPGLAARLQGDVEDTTGLTVMVGPPDSGQIPRWMESRWEQQS
ncbi:MAG: acetyl-CoA decarbonylase/synthase complex subunit gamma [Euryarchaeota archaeon]|nr:acetyl-CoA decarbonylase/synthase complex subunit gamma [Euryarchaeota archaeon]